MAAAAVRYLVYGRPWPVLCAGVLVCAVLLVGVIAGGFANARSAQRLGDNAEEPSSLHGTVLNRLTREPVGGALVYSEDNQYATLTDDHGRFAFQFPRQKPTPGTGVAATPNPRHWIYAVRARKPGYLDDPSRTPAFVRPGQAELTILLDPESRIVGHVDIPEGNQRVRLELFRLETEEGREHWVPDGTFRTWENGEFRFSNLKAGTYRLITDEQVDRDTPTPNAAEHLVGFPPVYYPGARDFASASNIQLAAGATFQADISLNRSAYYSVKIPVNNGTGGQPQYVEVYPLGNPSPGYSLVYNPGARLIQGFLPNGNYTVKVETPESPGTSGVVNFAVNGGPAEGAAVNLAPNADVTVNVKEEFSTAPTGRSVFRGDVEEPGDKRDGVGVPVNVEMFLRAADNFGPDPEYVSHPAEREPEHTLTIESVPPGRYQVMVQAGLGYAAVVAAGDTDLLHQPLVVGAGGSSPTIEVVLRDDGAEITGKVENANNAASPSPEGDENEATFHVYFLPVSGSTGQFRETGCDYDGFFAVGQLPPGTYRVLALDRERSGLANPDEETMREVESKGELIEVTANGKERLRLKLVPEGESQ